MNTLTVTLPDALHDFVEQEIEANGFADASEYFRSLIRAEQKRQAKDRLESMLLEGMASGAPVDVTPEFWGEMRGGAGSGLARKSKLQQK